MERLYDLRESFVEVLVVPRVQDRFAISLGSDRAIAVQLNFVGPIWSLGELRN